MNLEVLGYATHHDEPMLFPTREEAAAHCDDDEEPMALVRFSEASARIAALEAENEALRLPKSYGGSTFETWGGKGCTVRFHFTDMKQAQAWVNALTGKFDQAMAAQGGKE